VNRACRRLAQTFSGLRAGGAIYVEIADAKGLRQPAGMVVKITRKLFEQKLRAENRKLPRLIAVNAQ